MRTSQARILMMRLQEPGPLHFDSKPSAKAQTCGSVVLWESVDLGSLFRACWQVDESS